MPSVLNLLQNQKVLEVNPQVDEFISKLKKWQPEFAALRKIILDCGLEENFKWKQPCYTFQQ